MSSTHAVVVPTSATPVKQLSDDERRKQFAQLRERMSRSRLEVTAPPGRHPYWARKQDEQELARLEWLGFTVVRDDPKAPLWKAAGLREDGTYSLGDVILMSIDEDTYQFLLEEDAQKAQNLVGSVKQSTEDEINKAGAPTFQVDKPTRRA